VLGLFTSKVRSLYATHPGTVRGLLWGNVTHCQTAFFLDQAHKRNNVKITEYSEVLGPLQHLSLFSADDCRTRWSKGIKEFEATVRKRNCLTMMCRTDKIK